MFKNQDFSDVKGLALEFCLGISIATEKKPNRYLNIAKDRFTELISNLGGPECSNSFTAIIGLWAIREDVVLGVEEFERTFGKRPECLERLLEEMEKMYKSLFRM